MSQTSRRSANSTTTMHTAPGETRAWMISFAAAKRPERWYSPVLRSHACAGVRRSASNNARNQAGAPEGLEAAALRGANGDAKVAVASKAGFTSGLPGILVCAVIRPSDVRRALGFFARRP